MSKFFAKIFRNKETGKKQLITYLLQGEDLFGNQSYIRNSYEIDSNKHTATFTSEPETQRVISISNS